MLCVLLRPLQIFFCRLFFFFNDTATTEIYTLSLHDALPISLIFVGISFLSGQLGIIPDPSEAQTVVGQLARTLVGRSEEHTSELQSRLHLVCRLLLEKKKY